MIAALAIAAALAATPPRPLPPELKRAMEEREAKVGEERERAIQLLEDIVAREPDGPRSGDAMFKLAGLYWERARYAFLAAEGKAEHLDLRPSIDIYEKLAKKRGFERMDSVLYLLGAALSEVGRTDDSARAFARLIEGFPKSSYIPEARYALGEHAFEAGRFAEALVHYRAVAARGGPLMALALYKIAWSQERTRDWEAAAKGYLDVLNLVGVGLEPDDRLVEDALSAEARVVAETGKDPAQLLVRLGAARWTARVLAVLGDVFEKQAQFKKAIATYRSLVDREPESPETPQRLLAIARAHEKLGDPARALGARIDLAVVVGPGSAWARKQTPEVAKDAAELAEKELREASQTWHQQGQKERKDEGYKRACEGYAAYEQRFASPPTPHLAEIRWLHGEALFHLSRWRDAAEQYRLAAEAGKAGKAPFARDAAYAAALSLDKVVEADKPKAKTGLTAPQKQLLAAADAFVKDYPEDRRSPALMLRAGRLAFDRGLYDDAADRFAALLAQKPPADVAVAAADLLLDARRRSGDYAALEATAKSLKSNVAVAKSFGGKLDDVAAAARFEAARKLEKGGKQGEAAQAYEALANDYRGGTAVPIRATVEAALYNAGALREKLGEREVALADYDRCAREFGGRAAKKNEIGELAARAAFRAGRILEASLQLENAAQAFEAAAAGRPDSPEAGNALFNAGVLREALGDAPRAFKDLDAYARRTPPPPDAAEAFLRGAKALPPREAARELDGFAKRFPGSPAGIRADAARRHGLALLAVGRRTDADASFAEAVAIARKEGGADPLAQDAAAQARFELAEAALAAYEALAFDVPKNKLAARLNEKAEKLEKLKAEYLEVGSWKRPEWTAAAIFRVGYAYERFAQALFDAPVPAGLGKDEAEEYRIRLREQAYPIEEAAIRAYDEGLARARAGRLFSRWTRAMRERLAKLDPQGHPPEREQRPGAELAVDLPLSPPVEDPLR